MWYQTPLTVKAPRDIRRLSFDLGRDVDSSTSGSRESRLYTPTPERPHRVLRVLSWQAGMGSAMQDLVVREACQ